MGVDTKICLPHTARLDDIVKVLGILAGRPKHWTTDHGGRWVDVDGARAQSYEQTSSLTSCAEVIIDGHWPDGMIVVRCMFHFDFGVGRRSELGSEHMGRGLMPRSTPQWLAAGRRLLDFFGGWMDYQDCDDIDVDYSAPIREDITACDGDRWDEFQQRIWEVEPLTIADIRAMETHAYYVRKGTSS